MSCLSCFRSQDKTIDSPPPRPQQGGPQKAQRAASAAGNGGTPVSRLGSPPNGASHRPHVATVPVKQNSNPQLLPVAQPRGRPASKPKPVHSDTPAFLAVQPATANEAHSNRMHSHGKKATDSAVKTLPEVPQLKHNSPPSFKGFLTERANDEEQLASDGIMDSQDMWTPKNLPGSSRSLGSGENLNGFEGAGSSYSRKPELNSASSSVEKAEVGEETSVSGSGAARTFVSNRARASPRKQSLESTTASRSFADSPEQGSLRAEEGPWGAASHSKTPGVVLVNSRASSLGGESVRESDSGARPLHHSRSGNLSGSPRDPGQAGAELYDLVGQLGVGRTGTTKLMRDKRSNDLVAAKWVQHTAGETLSVQTEREIVNHRRLLHPNVVRFREVFATDEHLVIVMDYASVGHLSERIATGGALSEDRAKGFYRQLVDGMVYCHKQGIVHRNLRMENMLLDGQYHKPVLKISGFGYSKAPDLDSAPKTMVVGSPAYSPPEILLGARNEGYDGRAMDVWSSGVILFNLLTGGDPFAVIVDKVACLQDPLEPGVLSHKLMQRILKCVYELPKALDLSPECKDLLAQIFVPDPRKRIDSYAIQNHPWLAGSVLPEAKPVLISKQSESDISLIMERARKRRAARQAAQESQSKPPASFNEDLLED